MEGDENPKPGFGVKFDIATDTSTITNIYKSKKIRGCPVNTHYLRKRKAPPADANCIDNQNPKRCKFIIPNNKCAFCGKWGHHVSVCRSKQNYKKDFIRNRRQADAYISCSNSRSTEPTSTICSRSASVDIKIITTTGSAFIDTRNQSGPSKPLMGGLKPPRVEANNRQYMNNAVQRVANPFSSSRLSNSGPLRPFLGGLKPPRAEANNRRNINNAVQRVSNPFSSSRSSSSGRLRSLMEDLKSQRVEANNRQNVNIGVQRVPNPFSSSRSSSSGPPRPLMGYQTPPRVEAYDRQNINSAVRRLATPHSNSRTSSADSSLGRLYNRVNEHNGIHRDRADSPRRSQGHHQHSGSFGFLALKRIAKSDKTRVLTLLNQNKKGFMNIINSPIHDLDIYVIIIEILSKLSQSPFEESKCKIILDVCNSNFITSLRNYLMDLPYTQKKPQNRLYWEAEEEFWTNFIIFCADIVDISPTTAVRTCRALIESISKTCLEGLNQNHGYVLDEGSQLKLEELRQKLTAYANKKDTKVPKAGEPVNEDVTPPEDFRELNVIPKREDLLEFQPFLRPNITDGGYSDVEHYLDVQFRLLREDCFGPIRVGVDQYLSNQNKWRYDHVRVYRSVKFVGPYITNLKIGYLVQIDTSNKSFRRINWAQSKRFLFGSLVLLTKDRFQNCIVATVLDRDNMLLSMGKIAISIIDTTFGMDINSDDTYTMIESEVYYEPYYHVLRALQAPTFAADLPMQGYIVKVDANAKRPAYLTDDTVYSIPIESPRSTDNEILSIVNIEELANIKLNVSMPETWPARETLQFNESQYEAYKLALTHEFAVIQGPPGTGKTYVGLKVAETLLRNVKPSTGALMLVVCYTNHALDQFLEGISKVTRDIVRIGSQSRNKAMDDFNLANIRKLRNVHLSGAGAYFMEMKNKLKQSIDEFQETLLQLDILNNGVINFNAISTPEIQLLSNYYYKMYSNIEDPLRYWLFENCDQYGNLQECIFEYGDLIIDENDNEFNKNRKDNAVVMNDDKDAKERIESLKKTYSVFLLIDAKRQLKNLVDTYKNHKQQSISTYKLEMQIQRLHSQVKLFEDMMKCRGRTIVLNLNKMTDFSIISTENRWSLYFMWTRERVGVLEQQLAEYQESISSDVLCYEEARMMMDMELLKHKKIKVLGLTTSGAARMRKLIHAISPNIVIVEEAAEVLEQHIITSLPKTCQHLILIGDHQQLRPSASYMKLVKRYNIEVSLFERMITNGIHSRTLNIQHRMRPEIAALISPHIYPNLENHPSVETYGDVPGLEKSVFFFTHEHAEEEQANEASSRANHKEADLILALANYLIQQGYKSDEVTILAAYSGQMFYMRKERKKFVLLNDIKITVVDNYQGEESQIILLSLVRNNEENNIGFLGIENRICVALSRAKQGFYIFGNINMLKLKSELWTKIAATLVDNGALGTALNLKCQNHPDEITPVVNVDDFKKAPEGGCTKICNYQYQCGHRCTSFCHGYDRQHVTGMRCPNKCERILCDLNHVCPLYCRETCAPCKVYVPKILPCDHEQKIYCHLEPDDPKNKCLFEIEITLPLCGHKARKLCYTNIKDVICKEKCKLRLEKCGHTCELRCHVGKTCSEFNYLCKKECAKANKGCLAELTDDLGEHKCKKKCYEDCDNCNIQVVKRRSNCKHLQSAACSQDINVLPCNKKCARVISSCGHFCMRKCSEICGDCKIMVTKEIPECKHTINVMCKIKVTRELCYQKCSRTRSCGHPCTSRCGVNCDINECTHLTTEEVDSPCGHKTKLPCNIYKLFKKGELNSKEILKYCLNPCREDLACGHICSGTCSGCYQGRLHIPCKQTCNQLNICGHKCQEPCNQMCPPCNMPCEVKCAHSRCARFCGQPCVSCKEKCDRRCAHGVCKRICSQPCSIEACSLPCPLKISCGHRCRGVCGEPCPDICHICRPEDFPRGFIGEEYEKDDKFILLQDCGHIVELESMDSIMFGEQEIIKMKNCPYCRKPVINTNRYKRLVNDMIKTKINPIKRKIYGNTEAIKIRFKELETKISNIYKKYFQDKNQKDPYNLKVIFLLFIKFMEKKNKFFLLQVEMLITYCYIIETVTECWQAYSSLKTTVLEAEFRENIEMILKVLMISQHSKKNKVEIKISEQQQKNVDNEIKRLNSIVQLATLLRVDSDVLADANIKSCVNDAKATVLTFSIFDEGKAIESLNTLKTAIKSSEVIITKLARAMVIKAMPDMKAGHWFKCPNGHFYCIGECGGANQVGKCPDCGAAVGGTRHTLLPGNTHTGELDGSRYAAYSEEANNMANFLL